MSDLRRTIVTSDLHLTDDPKDEYRHEFVEDFVDICSKRGAERIAIIGDLTEQKDNHSARLVNKIMHHLHALSMTAPLVLLMGNHDYKDEGYPFFAFADMVPNVTWIDRPTLINGEYWLPHTRNYKEEWGKEIVEHKGRVWAHNTFLGADAGHGRHLDGIPLGYLHSTEVISGDVHIPQFLPNIKGKHQLGGVLYVGAPYTIDFGDDYDPRYLIVTGKKIEFKSLASFPQKRLVHVASFADLKKIKDVNSGDIVKVRVDCEDMENWADTHKRVLDYANDHEWQTMRVEPVVMRKTVRRNKKIDASQSDDELLESFAKRHTLTKETLNEGIELMNDDG